MPDPETKKRWHQEWRQRHKDRLRIESKAYQEAHKPEIKAYNEWYHKRHKMRLRAKSRQYYRLYRPEILRNQRLRYRQKNLKPSLKWQGPKEI